MAIPKRYETHVTGCALCGEVSMHSDLGKKQVWLYNHIRGKHLKENAYDGDAVRTVTIIFEGNGLEDQQSKDIDPTGQFLETIIWMNQRGIL